MAINSISKCCSILSHLINDHCCYFLRVAVTYCNFSFKMVKIVDYSLKARIFSLLFCILRLLTQQCNNLRIILLSWHLHRLRIEWYNPILIETYSILTSTRFIGHILSNLSEHLTRNGWLKIYFENIARRNKRIRRRRYATDETLSIKLDGKRLSENL